MNHAHYFDIETYSPNEEPNPQTDTILTIQFQKINLTTGNPEGRLQILKVWDMGEEEMLKLTYKWFFQRNRWSFIPIGFNLSFEWQFLYEKFKQYGIGDKELVEFYQNYPQIDLKVFSVIKNGSFQGASLSSISNKKEDGNVIQNYYEEKNYTAIEKYIQNEAESFVELYKKVKILLDENLKD